LSSLTLDVHARGSTILNTRLLIFWSCSFFLLLQQIVIK